MSVSELKTALEDLGVSFAGLLEKSEFGKKRYWIEISVPNEILSSVVVRR